MYKKDLLDRQFEEFGKVLAALMSLRKEKALDEYERKWLEAFITFTSSAPDKLEQLALDDFKTEVLQGSGLSSRQLLMLADLLYDKLNFYLDNGEEKKVKALSEKCLFLYTHLNSHSTENEYNLGIHYRIKFLNDLS